MGLRIRNPVRGIAGARNFSSVSRRVTTNFERLLSGRRIGRSKDNAASYQIATNMNGRLRVIGQVIRMCPMVCHWRNPPMHPSGRPLESSKTSVPWRLSPSVHRSITTNVSADRSKSTKSSIKSTSSSQVLASAANPSSATRCGHYAFKQAPGPGTIGDSTTGDQYLQSGRQVRSTDSVDQAAHR